MNENLYPNNNNVYSGQVAYQQAPNQIPGNQPVPPQKNKPGFGAGLGVGLGIGAVAILFMLVVVVLSNRSLAGKKSASDTLLNDEAVQKINALQSVIDSSFYDYNDEQITDDEMRDGLYKGLVSSLNDKYAAYYNEEEFKDMMESNEGVYYGVGAYISIGDDGYPFFQSIIEGTPAEESGLRGGDIIYKINDESAYGLTLDNVVSRVKGPEGTQVHLTIVREGESDYLEFDVTRRRVETPTVKHEMLEDNIGYIQITEFDNVTVNQFESAYTDIRNQGADRLIIDLRSNPGGMLNAVNDIARMILPEGVIVYEMNNKNERKDYMCDGKHEIDIPLVVLVNENSASASEILSGSIRDYGVGTLVGKNTYGKGIVQSLKPFSDGTAIKLTISAYYLPSGECIQGKGIAPDIEAEFDADKYYDEGIDTQLNKAIEVVKGLSK